MVHQLSVQVDVLVVDHQAAVVRVQVHQRAAPGSSGVRAVPRQDDEGQAAVR